MKKYLLMILFLGFSIVQAAQQFQPLPTEEELNILIETKRVPFLRRLQDLIPTFPMNKRLITEEGQLYLSGKLAGFDEERKAAILSLISEMTWLKTLTLGGNNLNSVPPSLANLTNLERLDLDGNNLTSLPPEMGNLFNLKELDLSKNNLSSVPPSFQKLQQLTQINLSGNPNLSENSPPLPHGHRLNQWGREEIREHFRDRVIWNMGN